MSREEKYIKEALNEIDSQKDRGVLVNDGESIYSGRYIYDGEHYYQANKFYTKDYYLQFIIKERNKAKKLQDVWGTFCILSFMIASMLGLPLVIEMANKITGIIILSLCGLCFLLSLIPFIDSVNFMEKSYNIIQNFFESEEFNIQHKAYEDAIKNAKKRASEEERRFKAEQLTDVYSTLDHQGWSREKKISKIMEYLKDETERKD